MTDTTDIKALSDRLRSLAKTATPGKWWIDSHGEALVAFTDEGIETVLKPEHLRDKAHRDENTGSLSYWPNDSDASWIAAAQPQNIIPLLDQLQAERHKGDLWFGKVADLEAALKAERQRADDCDKSAKYSAATNKSVVAANCRLQEEIAALKGEQVPVGFIHHLDVAELKAGGDAEIKPHKTADWQIPVFTDPQKSVVLPIDEMSYKDACEFVSINGMRNEDRPTLAMRVWNSCRKAAIEAAGGIVKDGE